MVSVCCLSVFVLLCFYCSFLLLRAGILAYNSPQKFFRLLTVTFHLSITFTFILFIKIILGYSFFYRQATIYFFNETSKGSFFYLNSICFDNCLLVLYCCLFIVIVFLLFWFFLILFYYFYSNVYRLFPYLYNFTYFSGFYFTRATNRFNVFSKGKAFIRIICCFFLYRRS